MSTPSITEATTSAPNIQSLHPVADAAPSALQPSPSPWL